MKVFCYFMIFITFSQGKNPSRLQKLGSIVWEWLVLADGIIIVVIVIFINVLLFKQNNF